MGTLLLDHYFKTADMDDGRSANNEDGPQRVPRGKYKRASGEVVKMMIEYYEEGIPYELYTL